jgi:RNA polymerase sigma-70 factor, ECF subfamily
MPSASTAEKSLQKPDSNAEERAEVSERAATVDAELVGRFKSGDESAFVEIITRYHQKIFSIAFGVIRNRADAEEIAQDTFIRAHRGLVKFRGESSLATWLHRVTVNLARNRYWYFFRRRRHATFSLQYPLSESGTETFADLMPTSEPQPSREAMTQEFTLLVTACMEKLPEAQREILELRNVLNHSYDEIAAALGIRVGTVKSRIARARGHLRDLISETCPEFGGDAAASDWFEPVRSQGGLAAVGT